MVERESQRLNASADFARIMLANATEPYFYPNHVTQPLEIHRSKISLTRAGAGYDYPTIRLPFAFSRLIGLSTRIYQTIHDALAFLVVVASQSSPNKSSFSSADALRLHTAKLKKAVSFVVKNGTLAFLQ
ncbi:MAG: hypothetical protein ABSD89_02020 [Halobacteriota archaeon]